MTRTSSRVPKKSPLRHSPIRKSPSRRSPSRRSPGRRSPSRQSPSVSPTTVSSRKLPIRSTRLAKISLSRIDHEGDESAICHLRSVAKTDISSINNRIESNYKKKILASEKPEERPIETIPLQQRLNEINAETNVWHYRTKQFSSVKSEQEHKTIDIGQSTRSIDRAVSLPLERKTYIHDYLPEEKERGYSMQRDQVNVNEGLVDALRPMQRPLDRSVYIGNRFRIQRNRPSRLKRNGKK